MPPPPPNRTTNCCIFLTMGCQFILQRTLRHDAKRARVVITSSESPGYCQPQQSSQEPYSRHADWAQQMIKGGHNRAKELNPFKDRDMSAIEIWESFIVWIWSSSPRKSMRAQRNEPDRTPRIYKNFLPSAIRTSITVLVCLSIEIPVTIKLMLGFWSGCKFLVTKQMPQGQKHNQMCFSARKQKQV
jgi:hypothetical protein